jgi:acyl-CoA thioesterase-1
MKILFSTLSIIILFLTDPMKEPVKYVALGDSYTIGTGTTPDKSWPSLLVNHLRKDKIAIELKANPAHNGWTTQDLIDNELPVFDQSAASFATLLIGVNDWVQGVDEKTFQKNLIFIIDKIQSKLPDRGKLILITIPDFGVTPTGSRYTGGRNSSQGISGFNKIIMAEAKKRNLKTVDLFEESKKMGLDNSLVAGDGLHPSAKEYAVWEALIYPVAKSILE